MYDYDYVLICTTMYDDTVPYRQHKNSNRAIMAGVTNKSDHHYRVVPRPSVVASTNSSRISSVVDASFVSITSTSSSGSNSYEVESEVGREALREICCSILSRVLDFPDGQLETFLGAGEGTEDIERKHEGVNVAK